MATGKGETLNRASEVSESSTFLRIPVEIRAIIWRLLFVQTPEPENKRIKRYKHSRVTHPILLAPWFLVNKQLREEQSQFLKAKDKQLECKFAIDRDTNFDLERHWMRRRLTYPSIDCVRLVVRSPMPESAIPILMWMNFFAFQMWRRKDLRPRTLVVHIGGGTFDSWDGFGIQRHRDYGFSGMEFNVNVHSLHVDGTSPYFHDGLFGGAVECVTWIHEEEDSVSQYLRNSRASTEV